MILNTLVMFLHHTRQSIVLSDLSRQRDLGIWLQLSPLPPASALDPLSKCRNLGGWKSAATNENSPHGREPVHKGHVKLYYD